MTTPILKAALRHVAARRPVFPCWPDKNPATPNGFHDASLDPDVVIRWFAYSSKYLLAIPTGKLSGLVVLDLDGDDAWEWLRDRERQHEPLPRTASVKTPRGGQHFLLKWPGMEVRCSVGQLAPKVDVRGDGGYVIVPPSRLPDGRSYEPDEQAPAAEMPPWLRELVTARNGNPRRTDPSERVRLVRDGVGEGLRNDSLARLLGHLLRKNVDVDLTAELAHLVNVHRFRPPLDGGEVDRVVNSIAAAELRRRRRSR